MTLKMATFMVRRNVLVLLAVLLPIALFSGCTTTPRTRAIAPNVQADYVLGLTIDEEMQVVAIGAESAATNAGVEVGDQLVSLTWILSEAPTELPTTAAGTESDAETAAEATDATPLRPPPGVEFKTATFTEPDQIRTMISYGLPLRLEVVRQGETHELTIVPLPRAEQTDLPADASGTTF